MSTLIVFAISLLIRLLYNFSAPANGLFACDGSEYLRNAQALYALFTHSGSGTLSSLSDLKLTGPVFPLFVMLSYQLLGQVPSQDCSWPILFTQSMISALTCVFIYWSGRLCWSRSVGLLAGCIASIYPAFVINSGRLYSETFALFLLSALLYLVCAICRNQRSYLFACLLAGISAAALQLTRSLMFTVSVVSILLIFAMVLNNTGKRAAFKSVLMFLIGFGIILVPWLGFSFSAFNGAANLIPDRAGRYNLFVGNNIFTQGWLSVPYPDITQAEHNSFLHIAYDSIHKSPGRWCMLMLDKSIRLFKAPWNDFRISLGPVSYHPQVLFHQLLLLLAVIGTGLAMFIKRSVDSSAMYLQQFTCRAFLTLVLATHLIYLLFITVPRYNLLAMPSIILFGTAGLLSITSILREHSTRHLGIGLLAAALGLFITAQLSLSDLGLIIKVLNPPVTQAFLSLCKLVITILFFLALWPLAAKTLHSSNTKRSYAAILLAVLGITTAATLAIPARANGRLMEWQALLPAQGTRAALSLVIPLPKTMPNSVGASYLLVDGSHPTDLTIRINGTRISAPFVPGLAFMGDLDLFKALDLHRVYLECGYIFDCLSAPANISNLDLRQWFLLPLPQELMESAIEKGCLKVELTPSHHNSCRVYGQYVFNKKTIIPSLSSCSWEKAFYGVENVSGLSDPRYDTKLTVSQEAKMIPDVLLLVDNSHRGKISSIVVPTHTETSSSTGQPSQLILRSTQIPTFTKQDFWIVQLSGTVRTYGEPYGKSIVLKPRIIVSAKHRPCDPPLNYPAMPAEWGQEAAQRKSIAGNWNISYESPWVSRNIEFSGKSRDFEFAFPLVPAAMPSGIDSIELHLSSTATASAPIALTNCKVEIYKCPGGHPLNSTASLHLPSQFSLN